MLTLLVVVSSLSFACIAPEDPYQTSPAATEALEQPTFEVKPPLAAQVARDGTATPVTPTPTPIPPTPTPEPPTPEPTPELTPEPTPDATVEATFTTGVLSEAGMDALLEYVGWPYDARWAAKAVARCESGWNTNATGSAGERGIWQIHPIHYDSTYDPVGNAYAALRISGGGYNWSAWSCKPY